MGWLTDGILKYGGFGHIGNWLLMLIGAYVGMYVFNMYGYKFTWYPLLTLAVTSAASFGLFVSMCVLKRVFG